MKVRNDFLEKVMRFGSLDTRMYRYRFKNVAKPRYQYAIIERVLLDDLPCVGSSWQLVATTYDGEHFIHA